MDGDNGSDTGPIRPSVLLTVISRSRWPSVRASCVRSGGVTWCEDLKNILAPVDILVTSRNDRMT